MSSSKNTLNATRSADKEALLRVMGTSSNTQVIANITRLLDKDPGVFTPELNKAASGSDQEVLELLASLSLNNNITNQLQANEFLPENKYLNARTKLYASCHLTNRAIPYYYNREIGGLIKIAKTSIDDQLFLAAVAEHSLDYSHLALSITNPNTPLNALIANIPNILETETISPVARGFKNYYFEQKRPHEFAHQIITQMITYSNWSDELYDEMLKPIFNAAPLEDKTWKELIDISKGRNRRISHLIKCIEHYNFPIRFLSSIANADFYPMPVRLAAANCKSYPDKF